LGGYLVGSGDGVGCLGARVWWFVLLCWLLRWWFVLLCCNRVGLVYVCGGFCADVVFFFTGVTLAVYPNFHLLLFYTILLIRWVVVLVAVMTSWTGLYSVSLL